MNLLNNLMSLKNDMVEKKWTICSFIFKYKSIEYIVLVKRFIGDEKRQNDYALVKLHFIKADNINEELLVEANCKRLIVDAKTLRNFFGIEYGDNLGDILSQFTKTLGKVIPTKMPRIVENAKIQKILMVKSLSKSDSEDPDKIYCIGLRRNPNGQHRSDFNSDKTKLLRTSLYEIFEDDFSISFCYSANSNNEKDDATIIRNFSINE